MARVVILIAILVALALGASPAPVVLAAPGDITTVAAFATSQANRVDALGRFVDQNGDGFVNINDITCVVSGFGLTSPQPWG
jgi:hypothetical protein